MFVVVVFAAGDGDVVMKVRRETFSPTSVPTAAPLSTREMNFKAVFASQVGDQVYEVGTPHYSAANWIINEDQQQLTLHSENLLQRYLLALLYFHTTNNGQDSWLSCNPPGELGRNENGDPIDDTVEEDPNKCVHFEATPKQSRPGNFDCYEILERDIQTRWLSNTFECDWNGVICQGGEVVLGIHLRKFVSREGNCLGRLNFF